MSRKPKTTTVKLTPRPVSRVLREEETRSETLVKRYVVYRLAADYSKSEPLVLPRDIMPKEKP